MPNWMQLDGEAGTRTEEEMIELNGNLIIIF